MNPKAKREDAKGKVWLSYNSPEYLQKRHGVPQEGLQNIAVVENLGDESCRITNAFSVSVELVGLGETE
jgi:hypothetical protein